jgi:hypothetical protein
VNRPGLPAIAYRLGTHGDFLERMLEAVRGGRLDALSTREPDDPTVALMDAWAVVADVLTFYQERIANEGFLRTATERRSLLELAREIGYELRPGVAAEALLTFTVDDSPGAPTAVEVPQGTKVLSVPEPGKQPQTFETVETIGARVERNAMRPLMRRAQTLRDDPARVLLQGFGLGLSKGEELLVNTGGTPMLVTVLDVAEDRELGATVVDLKSPPTLPPYHPTHRPRGRIDPDRQIPFSAAAVDRWIVRKRWEEGELQAFIAANKWDVEVVREHLAARAAEPRTSQGTADEGVFALRETLGFFGRSAPQWDYLPTPTTGTKPPTWEATTIWTDAETTVKSWAERFGVDVLLERREPRVTSPSWGVIQVPLADGPHKVVFRITSAMELSVAAFMTTGPAFGLRLLSADGSALPDPRDAAFLMRASTARVAAEKLPLADLPVETPVLAGDTRLTLDRMFLGMRLGQRLLLSGERTDPAGVPASEEVVLKRIVHENGVTTVHFETGLRHAYRRETVTLAGNVARATHGQTVEEALGSGDGATPHQRFALRQPPLTYVSAPTPSGGASTLELRVDGVLWEEADTLYGLGSGERRYVLRREDDGATRVTLGDGRSGARATTGSENVVGRYRTGIGLGGEVGPGRLTLMQTRPFGVREVTNPLAAANAADPEGRDAARANAPRTVRTLDRAVSLRDYEDMARGFSGIGKALALSLWTPVGEQIVVSVAGSDGAEVDPDSSLYTNLVASLRQFGDPVQRVRVESARVLHFDLAASLRADPALQFGDVLAGVRGALESRFGFEARELGRMVTAAELITAMQEQHGVVGVDLDRLYLTGEASGPAQVTPPALLPAGLAAYQDDGTLSRTDILVINAAGAELSEMGA